MSFPSAAANSMSRVSVAVAALPPPPHVPPTLVAVAAAEPSEKSTNTVEARSSGSKTAGKKAEKVNMKAKKPTASGASSAELDGDTEVAKLDLKQKQKDPQAVAKEGNRRSTRRNVQS
jgi:hypothetical protein